MSERQTDGTNFLDAIELGIGNWAWGDQWLWGNRAQYDDATSWAAFEASLAAGINFIDTAEMYGWGHAEQLLGRFMKAAPTGQRVLVAAKFLPLPWRRSRASLLNTLRKSLGRLGVTQVALYQIHWPIPGVSIDTWMHALADAVEAGLTRAVGVSNYSLLRMLHAQDVLARRGVALASNQVEYSLLHRAPERNGVLDACRRLGIRLIAYSPLGKGLLTGKYTPDKPPPGFRRFTLRGDLLARVQSLIGLTREIGEGRGGKTPAQVALNWAICKGALPIPGARDARQAEQNAGAVGWCLTDDEVAALDDASADL